MGLFIIDQSLIFINSNGLLLFFFFFSICRNSWSSIYSVVPTIIEIICHHITIWLIKIKSGENKMIRAILAIFAWEKCFLCSAAFFLSIRNFCHWHCKLFYHLAEQYSTDFFMPMHAGKLIFVLISYWLLALQFGILLLDGIRFSRVIALSNL